MVRYSDGWPLLYFDFYLHKEHFSGHAIESELICGVSMMVRRKAMQKKVGEVYDVYLHGGTWIAVSAFEASRYLKSTNKQHMGKEQVVAWG